MSDWRGGGFAVVDCNELASVREIGYEPGESGASDAK